MNGRICPKCGYIINKTQKNYTEKQVLQMNRDIIEKSLKRFSSIKTRENKRSGIKNILKYLYEEHGIKYLLDYDIDAIEDLFFHLDSRKICRQAKARYRTHLKTIVMYMLKKDASKGDYITIGYWNYILSDDFYSFSESSNSRDFPFISKEDVLDFISELRMKNVRDYIYFTLLCYSGCRIGGLTNLIIENIDFQKAIFQTQEKPTKTSSGWNTYYLPKKFLPDIRNYITRNFLKQDEKLCNISDQSIRLRLKKYRSWWPHLLRHTFRVNFHLSGISDIDAHFLLNHKPQNVDQGYLRQLNNYEHLREIYDQFFPY